MYELALRSTERGAAPVETLWVVRRWPPSDRGRDRRRTRHAGSRPRVLARSNSRPRLLQVQRRRFRSAAVEGWIGAAQGWIRRGAAQGWIRHGLGVGVDRARDRAAAEIDLLCRAAAEIDQLCERGIDPRGFVCTGFFDRVRQRWCDDEKKRRWEYDENKPAKINRADYSPSRPLGVEIYRTESFDP